MDEAREGDEFDWHVPRFAACMVIWSSGLVPEAIEPRRALLRREETGASEVLTFSDTGVFLANVNLRSRSLYMSSSVRLSVCLSVCLSVVCRHNVRAPYSGD